MIPWVLMSSLSRHPRDSCLLHEDSSTALGMTASFFQCSPPRSASRNRKTSRTRSSQTRVETLLSGGIDDDVNAVLHQLMKLVAGAGFEPAVRRLPDYEPDERARPVML